MATKTLRSEIEALRDFLGDDEQSASFIESEARTLLRQMLDQALRVPDFQRAEETVIVPEEPDEVYLY